MTRFRQWLWPAAVGATLIGWYVSDSLRHRREGAFGYDLGAEIEVDSPDFVRAAEALTGAPISDGSEVELFVNGDAIFPAILETIASRGADSEPRDLRLLEGGHHQPRRRSDL